LIVVLIYFMANQTTFNNLSNYFISLSNETGNLISNLKLQKLLYYAQAWHLAYFGERIIDGDFNNFFQGFDILSFLFCKTTKHLHNRKDGT